MLDHLTRVSCLAKALRRCEQGNSAVEFALAAPILILIAFGAFDYGSAYVEGLRLTGAAQAGVQQVLYDPVDWDNTDRVEQTALEEYFGEALTPNQIQTLPVSVRENTDGSVGLTVGHDDNGEALLADLRALMGALAARYRVR